jgi:hypothetical protein
MPSSLPALRHASDATPRDVKEVPFVELHDRRLQGVVSSGSDIQRVYVAFFESGTLNFSCSTNNNRPCGGLRGYPCNHLLALLREAVAQFGAARVARFLRLPPEAPVQNAHDILRHGPRGAAVSEPTSTIFSRFLSDLELLELPASDLPQPALAWFV